MKLKTSCFKMALKKDLTRFAPAWGLYTLCLLLGLILMADAGLGMGLPRAIAECIQLMPAVNLGWGLVAAQLLFGDLFTNRLCFGTHALPLRREGWFAAHTLSGLLFSLVPTALMSAAAMVLVRNSPMEQAWQICLWWFLGTNVQYILFFGTAVLSIQLSGNRFGSVLIYALAHFAALLCWYVADTVYTPLLFGIEADMQRFIPFCPAGQMVEYSYINTRQFYEHELLRGTFTVTENWWYLYICAAVGIVSLVLTLGCYRRRNLERAGDLLVSRKLNPIFLVMFSLACAVLLQMVSATFIGRRQDFVFLFVGLVAGFFGGKMLLERTARVFTLRTWLGCAALTAAMLGSLLLTQLDPLNLVTRIPAPEEILSVSVRDYMHHQYVPELTAPEDIANVRTIHEDALQLRLEGDELWYDGQAVESLPEDYDLEKVDRTVSIVLTYKLKNGRELHRTYYVRCLQGSGQIAKKYLSALPMVFGTERLAYAPVREFTINGYPVPENCLEQTVMEQLLTALTADSQAGTLVQEHWLHPWVPVIEYNEYGEKYQDNALWFYIRTEDSSYSFTVFADMENTMQWIRDRELDTWMAETLSR